MMWTISSTQPNLARLGLVYEDIRSIAAGANSVAHSLARFARQIEDEILWMEESPPPALESLYLDSNFAN